MNLLELLNINHHPRSYMKKSKRGFAAMSKMQQRKIAQKGGLAVSRNRRHMAEIGRKGGYASTGW